MNVKHFHYYSYEELVAKATSADAEQIDIDTLGAWFRQHGWMYWNGESYEINREYRLFPVYSEPDENGDLEILHYEIR